MSTEEPLSNAGISDETRRDHHNTFNQIRYGHGDQMCDCCATLLWVRRTPGFSRIVTDYDGGDPETAARLFDGAEKPTGEEITDRQRRVRTAFDAITDPDAPGAHTRYWLTDVDDDDDGEYSHVRLDGDSVRCARCGYPTTARNNGVGQDDRHLRVDDISLSVLGEDSRDWHNEHVNQDAVRFGVHAARCFADGCFWLRKIHGSESVPWFSVVDFVSNVNGHLRTGEGTTINHALRDGFARAVASVPSTSYDVRKECHRYRPEHAEPIDVTAEAFA
jgi:hypothetical protein